MNVHEFDEQDKKEEKEQIEFAMGRKTAELKELRLLATLKDSPDIQKFIKAFMIDEYQIVGLSHDKELETNKNFWLKGRAYQLRKQLNWETALKHQIKKVKDDIDELRIRLIGERPEHEPE